MELSIRKADKKDEKAILEILKEMDVYYPSLEMKDFWVAEENEEILGVVQLEEYPDFVYLGSLAVKTGQQGRGIAKKLLNETLPKFSKNIYLYTIIPDFFVKFGFKAASWQPPDLPSKDRFECQFCHAEKCVCMVKYPQ
jgi:N-acetylglutamate synthase-like GNAT family acetyltransferase